MKKYIAIFLFCILMFCSVFTSHAADSETLRIADELHELGLLNGVGTDAEGNIDYDLDSPLTRQQAITFLVRFLGATEEAENGIWLNPFADVDNWALPYVGYCYVNGITSGISADQFGAKDYVTASQFITFILRSLGYSSSEDFVWNRSWEFSDTLGITDGDYNSDNDADFLRADAIKIMYAALAFRSSSENGELSEEDPSVQEPKPADEEIPEEQTPENQEPISPAVNETVPDIVTEALKYDGYPYKAGGKGPNAFDCSGFCIYVLKQCGYSFTAGSSQDLYNLSTRVSASKLRPGDLVFFKGTYDTDKVSHSGIYIGDGMMIHAGTSRTGVYIVGLNERYWKNHFYAYGRMPK